MLARAAVASVAVAVLAWLAVMERDTRLAAHGAAALRPGTPASALPGAERDLRRAGLLNPDAEPDVNRALVRRVRGDSDGAEALIAGVVRREPENLVAWAVLGVLAREHDPAGYDRALAARSRLDPLNARGH
jgi:hypothetical protein